MALRFSSASVALALFVAACGARTGLLVPTEEDDASSPPDASHDATKDVTIVDAPEEIDDVADVVFPDVPITTSCVDAGITYIYVLGVNHELYSFYPPTLGFTFIGKVQCPSTVQANSMAVTRSGIAFANYSDGTLYEVSTANAACKSVPYDPNQHGFQTFGMGYVADADGGETLYVAGQGDVFSQGLGTIDTSTFMLSFIGQFNPLTVNCELTGTGDGRLFGFCPFDTGSYLLEIDPKTANVISSHQLSTAGGGGARTWAFAFWGGDFWLFTGPDDAPSTVTEYDPVALTETIVATAPVSIVGAGVSTCAPE
jgi:hypothetical protein